MLDFHCQVLPFQLLKPRKQISFESQQETIGKEKMGTMGNGSLWLCSFVIELPDDLWLPGLLPYLALNSEHRIY